MWDCGVSSLKGFGVLGPRRVKVKVFLVAEWIHFTLFGIIITHYKTESVHFWGLMNSATRF